MAGKPGRPRTLGPTCGAKTSHGPCKNAAGERTSHPGYGRCYRHGGSTRNGTLAAQKTQAEEACARFGVPVETSAIEALIDLLAALNGEVMFYRARVAELGVTEMTHGITERRYEGNDPQPGGEGYTVFQSKPNVWILLLNDAEKRLHELAADMTRIGIEDRRMRLAEQQGAVMLKVIMSTLAEFGVQPDDPRIPDVMPRIIKELTAA